MFEFLVNVLVGIAFGVGVFVCLVLFVVVVPLAVVTVVLLMAGSGKGKKRMMDKDKRGGAFQVVTFGQAKGLKAVGYDWCCRNWYNSDGVFRNCDFIEVENYNGSNRLFTAPTVALALKWCREVKGIDAFVKTEPNGREPPVNLSYLAILGGRLVSNYCRYYDEAESALLDAVLAEISEGGAK